MTKEEFGLALRMHIYKTHGTMASAAEKWGVSGALVSSVVRGRKRPTQAMLDDIGFECIPAQVNYRKKRPAASLPKPEGEAK